MMEISLFHNPSFIWGTGGCWGQHYFMCAYMYVLFVLCSWCGLYGFGSLGVI